MTVFKAFFRVARRNLWPVLLYMGLMGLVAMLMISAIGDRPSGLSVSTEDFKLAVVNEDADDPVSRDLVAFVGQRAQIKPLKSGEKELQDALFWRDVDYVLTIPKGFGAAALTDQPMEIKSYASPNDYTHMYIDMQVNRYLSTLRAYRTQLPDESYEQSQQRTLKDLAGETPVIPVSSQRENLEIFMFMSYLRYMSYVLMAAITSGMGIVLMAMLNRNTLNRRRAGSLTETRFNLQLLMAGLVYSSLIWLFLVLLGGILTKLGPGELLDKRVLLMVASSYVYMLFSMAFTLFVTAFTQKREIITGVSNVMALGSSFLSGVFIPRQLLGEGVLAIGRMLPAYWYADAVSVMGEAAVFDQTVLSQYARSMGILALMLAVVISLTLLVNAYRRQKAI